MADSQFAVEMRSVSKRFPNPGGGEVTAVDQVTLEIQNGEFLTLLGPSGCGKTTSLRMIAGFEFPSEGAILIKGQNMGHKPPYLRPVNTVFQNYALFQHMTIAQNVAFGLEMDKVPKKEINQRVDEALEMVQLSGLGKRHPRQLSGGQQQRIALARALVKRPQVLLLDEPLGALDQKLRKEMQLELKALQQQVGITFVFVTHDQEEALTMSDRIAVMNKGRVLQIGGPVEIYERPNCQFVADFIGQTNFLHGKLVQVNGTYATAYVPALNLDFEGLKVGDLVVGDAVVLSVRPEKIHLSDREQIRTNSFYARVTQVAYIGSNTHVYIETDSGVKLRVWEQNKISTLDPLEYYEQGDQAWVTCFRENVLVIPEGEA